MSRAETALGTLVGDSHGGARRFRGVPFAQSPTAALRFNHPRPPSAWSGERNASQVGPAPIQPEVVGLGMRGAARTSEDCLTLNVFTPACDNAKRPVFVWIFGGAYTNGDGADPLFDGSNLAIHQDIVVVTINYRLGALGFARIIDDNCGLADQIAALEFVAAHIGRFGGDPGCVTIAGESAGAMSVCNLLSSPRARGLFHRAIAQSGAASNVATAGQAREAAGLFRQELGTAAEAADVDSVLSAQMHTATKFRARHRVLPFRPWIDGYLLPEHPLDVAGASPIPLIMGMNAHENRLYVRPSLDLSREELTARIATRVGEHAPAVLAHYLHERTQSPINVHAAILSDIDTALYFRRPMLDYARRRGAPTWLYQFDWPSPALRGWLGACHAIEIPFVFGNFDLKSTAKFVGSGPDADRLADRMMGLWGHFARHGAPPADWPAYQPKSEQQLHLDRDVRVASLRDDATQRFWEALG